MDSTCAQLRDQKPRNFTQNENSCAHFRATETLSLTYMLIDHLRLNVLICKCNALLRPYLTLFESYFLPKEKSFKKNNLIVGTEFLEQND